VRARLRICQPYLRMCNVRRLILRMDLDHDQEARSAFDFLVAPINNVDVMNGNFEFTENINALSPGDSSGGFFY